MAQARALEGTRASTRAAEATARPLALRSLTEQRDIVCLERGPLLIGRQSGADLVLTDKFVSQRHARLAFEGDELVVEDLDSTNGTYVNGVRVTRGCLAEGDRIMLGGSILKVVFRDGSQVVNAVAPLAAVPAPSAPATASAAPGRAASAEEHVGARTMSGRLDQIPLPELLQLLGTTRKSGVLAIRRDGHAAELRLDDGRVTGCVVDGQEGFSTQKSFFRLLAWTSGTFELRAGPAAPGDPAPATYSIGALLMDGLQQVDELQRLLASLPTRFAVCAVPDGGLDEHDRELLALAAQDRSLAEVLDATPLVDLEAARRIARLLAQGALVGDLGRA